MADEFTWKLSEIRTRFRKHIGKSQTAELSDADCNKWINDYYQNHFPNIVHIDDYSTFFTQSTSATDNGEYSLAQTEIAIGRPVFLNNDEIELFQNPDEFFARYPENEQYITAPTLVIGTGSAAKVKHSAFTYQIAGYSYSKASSEVDLTGSAIPEGKYGAWSLKINSSGTITVAAASNNATGYATPRLAIDDLTNADADSCFMGYVTAINSSGVFTPATTLLSAATVTDTYTDGQPDNRGQPECICVYNRKLYVRPRANDIYQIKTKDLIRPSVFASDDSVPANKKWGPMIAAGTAILYLMEEEGDFERANDIVKVFELYSSSIRDDYMKQLMQRSVERNW